MILVLCQRSPDDILYSGGDPKYVRDTKSVNFVEMYEKDAEEALSLNIPHIASAKSCKHVYV